MILRSVGVLSCGKIAAAVYTVMGLIVGVMFAFIGVIGALADQQGNNPDQAAFAVGFSVAGIIFFPILYGVIGFIGGVIVAAVYNVVAGAFGGIEMEFDYPPGTVGMQ